MATVSFHQVSKRFGAGKPVLDGIDLDVPDGAFCVLLGPSGCGKSTLLRIVAGLEDASAGEVRIAGARANEKSPKERNIAMVFQSYALYPHLSVLDNIAFPLEAQGVGKAARRAQAARVAESVQLGELLHRKPAQLSGGQRQRVALARAIIRQPAVFLFDEPLSNLDAAMRHAMRVELRALHQRLGVTSLYVTHDQEEALALADRIVVLHEGKVQQIGTPMEVYHSPANKFVAGFVGTPAMNFVRCTIRAHAGEASLVLSARDSGAIDSSSAHSRSQQLRTPASWARTLAAHDAAQGWLGVRPTALSVSPASLSTDTQTLAMHVRMAEMQGDLCDLHCEGVAGDQWVARVRSRTAPTAGQTVSLAIDWQGCHVFLDGESGHDGARRVCGGDSGLSQDRLAEPPQGATARMEQSV
jgi:ABC-type sugar transport system ATPase subunit